MIKIVFNETLNVSCNFSVRGGGGGGVWIFSGTTHFRPLLITPDEGSSLEKDS
jgi:hypothetical protein